MSVKPPIDDASIKRAVEHQVTKALYKGVSILKSEIDARTPVKDGELVMANTSEVKGKEAAVSNNKIYARRVHFGFEGTDSLGRTYHQKPQPYMRDGAKVAKTKVEKAMKSELMAPLNVSMSTTVIEVGKK